MYYRVDNSLTYFRRSIKAVRVEDRVININIAFETLLPDKQETEKRRKMLERIRAVLKGRINKKTNLKNIELVIEDRNLIIHNGLPASIDVDSQMYNAPIAGWYCSLARISIRSLSMSHEPRLSVYKIRLQPYASAQYNSNKWLFRNIIGEANTTPLQDSFIMTETFRKVVEQLDQPEMYADKYSKKCMTANQADIADHNVAQNLSMHSDQFIIEGSVEGGSFGRNRRKTSTIDKTQSSAVAAIDAITENFYFLLHTPFQSHTSILMLLNYSDDSIDSVMKKFWSHFFSFSGVYKKPKISRFIPQTIIENFKRTSTVSSLSFSTEIPGDTLLDNLVVERPQNYKVTIQIEPVDNDFTIDEYKQNIQQIERTSFASKFQLFQFSKKKGSLRDLTTNKTTPFDLGGEFDIQPSIMLSKFIEFEDNENDKHKIKDFCFNLLEDIKTQIYPSHAVRER